jgi:hypothetical protein
VLLPRRQNKYIKIKKECQKELHFCNSRFEIKNLPNNRFENLVDLLLFPAKPFLDEIPKGKQHNKNRNLFPIKILITAVLA